MDLQVCRVLEIEWKKEKNWKREHVFKIRWILIVIGSIAYQMHVANSQETVAHFVYVILHLLQVQTARKLF